VGIECGNVFFFFRCRIFRLESVARSSTSRPGRHFAEAPSGFFRQDGTVDTPTAVLGYYGKRPMGAPMSAKGQALKPLVDRCREIDGKHLRKTATKTAEGVAAAGK
jgi:hypothetical protein